MIILAALLAMQGFSDSGLAPGKAATNAAGKAEPDISTLEKKLESWKGRWGYEDGKFVCETRTSSGETAVDAVGCRALVTCLGPEGQRLNSIAQGVGDDKERASEIQSIVAKSAPCVADKRHQGLVALAEMRGYKGSFK